MSVAPRRVLLFIDAQNLYRDAREAFHRRNDPSSFGQVLPWQLGELVAGNGPRRGGVRRLDQVRVYTDVPSASKQPRAYAAHMRQRAVWREHGVRVFGRPIRYPRDWPATRAQEKGVDVALAVDLVFGAARRSYDVAVVASTDTDLLPALEAVVEWRRAWGTPQIEVMCWSPLYKRLRVAGEQLYCHYVDRTRYESVRDPTSYAR